MCGRSEQAEVPPFKRDFFIGWDWFENAMIKINFNDQSSYSEALPMCCLVVGNWRPCFSSSNIVGLLRASEAWMNGLINLFCKRAIRMRIAAATRFWIQNSSKFENHLLCPKRNPKSLFCVTFQATTSLSIRSQTHASHANQWMALWCGKGTISDSIK